MLLKILIEYVFYVGVPGIFCRTKSESSAATKARATDFYLVVKVLYYHLLIWGPRCLYTPRKVPHSMIKRNPHDTLYLLSRNIVYYQNRPLLLFKHVNCLSKEVE